jgi:hypothetical protein
VFSYFLPKSESIYTKPLIEVITFNNIKVKVDGSSLRAFGVQGDPYFKSRYVYATVFLFNIFYVVLVSTALDPFNCKSREDGTLVLVNSPSIVCFNSSWYTRLGGVVAAMVIYQIGIPFAMICIFWKGRNVRRQSMFLQHFGTLTVPYHDSMYWWEIVNLFRRSYLSTAVGFYGMSDTVFLQLFLTMSMLFLIMLLQVILSPYRRRLNNVLSFTWSVVCLLVLFSGVVYPSDSISSSDKNLYAGIIIGIVSLELVLSSVILGVEISNNMKVQLQERLAREQFFETNSANLDLLKEEFPNSFQILWDAISVEDAERQQLFFKELTRVHRRSTIAFDKDNNQQPTSVVAIATTSPEFLPQ